MLKLPRQIFRYNDLTEQLDSEQEMVTPLEKVSWTNGVYQHMKGAAYPFKTMCDYETMWILNIAKRLFIESFRFFKHKFFIPIYITFFFIPFFMKKKVIEHFVKSYVSTIWKPISPYVLLMDYQTAITQEFEYGIYLFLKELEVKDEYATKFAEIFASIVEYDTAYRYRLTDIMDEADKKALLANPSKEIIRLLNIIQEREINKAVSIKFEAVALLIGGILLHPRFRKAFKRTIARIDIDKMGYDEIDSYWVCLRKDGYNYMGKTEEEREKMLEGKSRPALEKRKK